MKKVILMTACTAAVLLSGCSDNELASVGDGIGTSTQSAIGFHVVGNQAETRANIINASTITSTDFNVFAFTKNDDGTDGNFFMGEKEKVEGLGPAGITIKNKNNNWNYANPSDIHYWPASTALNFYAVNPATVADNMLTHLTWSITKDKKTITYLCCNEYENSGGDFNYDVMYAIAKDQTKDKNAGKVNFQFKHILSQVVFKAKTQLENMEVEINKIKIHNCNLGGIYTLPTGSATEGTWATPTGKPVGKFTVGMEQNIKVTSTVTDISEKKPMLVVPQTLIPWDTNEATAKSTAEADKAGESYLVISCKIKQNGEYVFAPEGNYGTLYVPFGPTWEQGKRYIYTLIFGGGYDAQGQAILQPINFDAEVGEWKNADAKEIGVNK